MSLVSLGGLSVGMRPILVDSSNKNHRERYLDALLQGRSATEIEVTNFVHAAPSGAQQAWFFRPKRWHKICVFIHGTGNDALFPYGLMFKELMRSGYAVITLDVDGHGVRSIGNLNFTNVHLSLHQFLQSLPEKFSELQERKIYLLGHSLGAAIIKNMVTKIYQEDRRQGVLIAAAGYLSLPVRLKVNIKSAVVELAGLLSPSYREHIKQFGLWTSLPAVGRFKRKAYPIRFEQPASYIHEVGKYIQESSPNWKPSLQIPEIYIHAGRDYLIDPFLPIPLNPEQKLSHHVLIDNQRLRFLVLEKETHLSLCTSSRAVYEVTNFFEQT